MKGLSSLRQRAFALLSLSFALALPACGANTVALAPTPQQAVPSDLVVLGQIDACWTCQHEPLPHVSYTRVLAGKAPTAQAQGELNIVEVPPRLLKDGTLTYKSPRAEICYLKLVEPPLESNPVAYKVVDVQDATADNLAKFNPR